VIKDIRIAEMIARRFATYMQEKQALKGHEDKRKADVASRTVKK